MRSSGSHTVARPAASRREQQVGVVVDPVEAPGAVVDDHPVDGAVEIDGGAGPVDEEPLALDHAADGRPEVDGNGPAGLAFGAAVLVLVLPYRGSAVGTALTVAEPSPACTERSG